VGLRRAVHWRCGLGGGVLRLVLARRRQCIRRGLEVLLL
jgi:hypothetical protein